MEERKALKRKAPARAYVYLTLSLLAASFTLIEASLGGSASGVQSDFVSQIGAFFINLFGSEDEPEPLKPTSIELVSDSSFLGEGTIAQGTSSRLGFEIAYPKTGAYDQNVEITRLQGEEGDYSLVYSSGKVQGNVLNSYVNVIGKNPGEYALKVEVADSVSYQYDFTVLECPAPSEFSLPVPLPEKMETGEAVFLPLLLEDSSGKALSRLNLSGEESEEEVTSLLDHYLRRVYDPAKVEAKIDGEGLYYEGEVLYAEKPGTYHIEIGPYAGTVEVTGAEVSPSSFTIAQSGQTYLNGYDFAEDGGNALLLEAEGLPEDAGVAFALRSEDALKAKIKPVGKDQAILYGYRNEGEVEVRAFVPGHESEGERMLIDIQRAAPTDLKVNGNDQGLSLSAGSQMNLDVILEPAISAGSPLVGTSSDPSIVEVIGSGTPSLAVRGIKTGKASVTVSSPDNEELKVTVDIEVKPRAAINEDNSMAFAGFIRKFVGHFLVFFVQGLFAFLAVYHLWPQERKKDRLLLSLLISIIFALLVGIVSECIQFFIPLRGPKVSDVGLDVAGAALGALIPLLWKLFRKEPKKEDSQRP